MIKHEPMLHYWYAALSSRLGIELTCSNPDKVRDRLYRVRAEAHDTDLDAVTIQTSRFDHMKLWLVKKEPQND